MVTLSAHLPHPGGGGLRDRDVDLSQLLVAGSAVNLKWMRTLDSVAAGLSVLRDAGVVVPWRPLHEMNGNWFWWNGKWSLTKNLYARVIGPLDALGRSLRPPERAGLISAHRDE